jgi:peroxiredoxin
MALDVGSNLPDITIHTKIDGKVEEINFRDWCADKKIVLFYVPGAFTQTCTNTHLPGFVRHCDQFAEKAVDAVACLSVNDVHVMHAWGDHVGALGKIVMLADSHAELARALGVNKDFGSVLGERAVRCGFIVDKGKIVHSFIEEPGQLTGSGAEAMLEALG